MDWPSLTVFFRDSFEAVMMISRTPATAVRSPRRIRAVRVMVSEEMMK